MMAGRYLNIGTPGTTERARQDAMIAAAGGIYEYMRGARPRDTSGGKLSA